MGAWSSPRSTTIGPECDVLPCTPHRQRSIASKTTAMNGRNQESGRRFVHDPLWPLRGGTRPSAKSGSGSDGYPRATCETSMRLVAIEDHVIAGDPYGTRTRVFAVRGRRPRPLDEGAVRGGGARLRGGGGGVKRERRKFRLRFRRRRRLPCQAAALRRSAISALSISASRNASSRLWPALRRGSQCVW